MREKDLNEDLATLAYKAEADHEVQMARADLYKIAKYAIQMHEMLKGVSEEQGLEGWVQSKITKAADYLGAVYHHMDYEQRFDEVSESVEQVDEIGVGLAARYLMKRGTQAAAAATKGPPKPANAVTKKSTQTIQKNTSNAQSRMNKKSVDEESDSQLSDDDKKVLHKLTGMIKQKQQEFKDARKGGYDEDVRMIGNQLEDFYDIAELIKGNRPMGLDTAVMDLVHDMYDEVGGKFESTYKDHLKSMLESKLKEGTVNSVAGSAPSTDKKVKSYPKQPKSATASVGKNAGKTGVKAQGGVKEGVCSECGNPSYTTLPEEKQKGVDGKVCWKGYKRMGTKKKGGKTVDNCVKM